MKIQIHPVDRTYYLHREQGCTVLTIEVDAWPGNEFGLWGPETVLQNNTIVWQNWGSKTHQDFELRPSHSGDPGGSAWVWQHVLPEFEFTATIRVDEDRSCVWYTYEYRNTSKAPISGLNSQTCFHMVNAPQFISVRGERLWACMDGQWKTTDRSPRGESVNPHRVAYLKLGQRTQRTVERGGFGAATMPEPVHHPLFIAESFEGKASVGIATRNYERLFNNNDYILRCLHSEGFPIDNVQPGQTGRQEGVLLFCQGDHTALLRQFEEMVAPRWR